MRGDLVVDYWKKEHPILLQALADQTPGMRPDTVADLLVDVEKELTSTTSGSMVLAGDNEVVLAYLDILAVPEEDHHGKHHQ